MLTQMVQVLALLLTFQISICFAGIGTVEKQTGPAQLTRSDDKITVEKDLPVELLDTINTADGIIGIGFNDDTKVQIEKHSKLIIDDFIYDAADPKKSKLKMKVGLGTVKYASGKIAKNARQNVDIQTPTARIGVRGTAFSMTVDEIGRSLVILLPNADGTVGEISVESDMGQVLLTQAYQATMVGTRENPPTPPVLLDLTANEINNLLIVQKPREKDEEGSSQTEKNILDFNELDINLLDKNELDEDELVFTRLDFNLLDVELLANILDLMNAKLLYETETFPTNPIRPGSYEEGKTQIVLDGEWIIYREVDGRVFSITLDQNSNTQMNLNQAGSPITLHTTENASDTVININQN
jgi:hypothetical protein